MQVFIGRRAERNIDSIAQYISMQGYPETAVKFITRLRFFIYQIADFPARIPQLPSKILCKARFSLCSF